MNDAELEGRIGAWLREAACTLQTLDVSAIARAARALEDVRRSGHIVFVAGNGGSASTASHLALDLQKAARAKGGRGTRALALSDSVGLISAWANDEGFERVFAEQLDVLATPGDAVVVISVSGSSPNLLGLLAAARRAGLVSVGLLGRDGGQARTLVDHPIVVGSPDYGWVESVHVVLHHVLTYALRDFAAGNGGTPASS